MLFKLENAIDQCNVYQRNKVLNVISTNIRLKLTMLGTVWVNIRVEAELSFENRIRKSNK